MYSLILYFSLYIQDPFYANTILSRKNVDFFGYRQERH